jgi:hypothetical protein
MNETNASSPGSHVMPGPNDSWTCSNCGGYVRYDAESCKHCHVTFAVAAQQHEQMKVSMRHQWQLLVCLIIAGAVGWLITQVVAGIGGIALAWLVGMTLLWAATWRFGWLEPLNSTQASPPWRVYGAFWLFLCAVVVVPVIGSAYTIINIAGWPSLPVGFSVFISLALLVLKITVDLFDARTQPFFSGHVSIDNMHNWRWLARRWAEAHVVIILPLATVEWVRAKWGQGAGGVANLFFLLWISFGAKRASVWLKGHNRPK